ncbi:MAG: hypothetical protein CK426_06250 [Legionella sp.]|nr:MAG: hypothetical protein CK423_02470 [Legionella sp.]PJD98492.1 MAG: hypothetical protein CK426_06250 [Legionella sp.]
MWEQALKRTDVNKTPLLAAQRWEKTYGPKTTGATIQPLLREMRRNGAVRASGIYCRLFEKFFLHWFKKC